MITTSPNTFQLNSDGTPIVESEIIHWANKRLEDGGKNVKITGFQDKANKTALPIIHLIDVMKPGVIDYSIVKQGDGISGPVSKLNDSHKSKLGKTKILITLQNELTKVLGK